MFIIDKILSIFILSDRIDFFSMVAELEKILYDDGGGFRACLLYTSPSPRDRTRSRMPSSA